MTKQEAISLFGTTTTDLARALGITSQAAGRWPDELSERQTREVIGAAVRLGKLRDVDGLADDTDSQSVAA